MKGRNRREHTMHVTLLRSGFWALIVRFGVGSFVLGSAPQAAAHVNFVFGGANGNVKEKQINYNALQIALFQGCDENDEQNTKS